MRCGPGSLPVSFRSPPGTRRPEGRVIRFDRVSPPGGCAVGCPGSVVWTRRGRQGNCGRESEEVLSTVSRSVDELCVDTIRTLAIDAVQKAESGHPGLPLGAAPMAHVLWQKFLKHDPRNPTWPDRDRFVLSAGHGCMLLYCLLYLTGYDLSLDDLKQFRQWGSKTPGHPEYLDTPGVEATTGPLGQGTANAVGVAIAERMLASYFNRPEHEIVNHRTIALVSDGDLMEGISSE